MSPRHRCALSILVAAVILAVTAPAVSAQIIEFEQGCSLEGTVHFAMPCGTDGDYAYVFIGSVVSVVEARGEKSLRVMPEEIFLGSPVHELTVTTSHGDCLPDFRPGDKWLFYLPRDDATQSPLVAYGSPSKPLAAAQQDVARLRHLVQTPDAGMIIGSITRQGRKDTQLSKYVPGAYQLLPVANHKVVAKRVSEDTEYSTVTGANGHYELELPPGSYEVTANTAQGSWAEEGRVEVHAWGCSKVDLELRPDGSISGHVRTAYGELAKHALMEAILQSGPAGVPRTVTATVDEQGYFQLRGLYPGRYLVGMQFLGQAENAGHLLMGYYPGTLDKSLAVIIELGQDEKLTNIDFQAPNSAIQPAGVR